MERLCTTAQYFNSVPGKGPEEKEKERDRQKNLLNQLNTHTYTATRTDLNGSIKLDLKIKNACD